MVLALRGHHIDLCPTHASTIEKLQRSQYDFVLYGIEESSPTVKERLREIRSAIQSTSSMLIGIVDEHELPQLSSDVMNLINQVLERPLDLDMLDLQFETFEQAALSLQASEYTSQYVSRVPFEMLAQLAHRGMDLGALLNAEGHIQFTTAGIEAITGHDSRACHGRSILSLVHPDDRSELREMLSSRVGDASARVRFMGDGERISWFDVRLTWVASDRETGSFVLVGTRASSRPTAIGPSISEGHFESDLIAHIDRAGTVLFRTSALAELLGLSEQSEAVQLSRYIIEADQQAFRECLDGLPIVTGGQRRCLVRVRTADDSWRSLDVVCTNLLDVEGIEAIVVNADDVTRRKSVEHNLMRRALLDPLTGLPNRVYFMNRLERALDESRHGDASVAVLFLDLDRFKLINDSLGHEAGDQLLIAVGQRLKTAVRPGDIVARFGGDELIVLLEEVAEESDATVVAERIIEGVRRPLVVEKHEISISTSIGVAVGGGSADDANLLIRNADIALYRAKELGASRYTVFDESMAQRVVDRLEMENELRHALEREQLSVEFLPELNLHDGSLSTLEVLTRWKHPELGEILPDTFIDVAEESGMIVNIGRWAFVEACRHVQRWQSLHPDAQGVMIAFNKSVREFQQPDLVPFIVSTLAEYDIAPDRLRIEIDERSLAADPDDTLEKVRELRKLGICFAIDNFGRGFSSLSIFTRSDFDVLKVDRQFISGDEHMASSLSVVRAVTSLAHALGMRVTAEGIETREHLARVQAAGCDFGQGYLFSKSLDAGMTESLFHSSRSIEAA